MAEQIKHGGCYDCESTVEPVLTSVLATRLFGKRDEPTRGSYALCSKCVQKEIVHRG